MQKKYAKTLYETAKQSASKLKDKRCQTDQFRCKHDDLLTVISKRDQVCMIFADKQTVQNKLKLETAQNTVQKELKNAKKEWIESQLEIIEQLDVDSKYHQDAN